MASTAILQSQDCLLRHDCFHYESLSSPPSETRRNANGRPNSMRPRRRRRSPVASPDPDRVRGQNRTVVGKFPAKNLVMGQVKILKRGEELKPARKNIRGSGNEHLVLCSTDRLGPEPETVQEQIKVSDLKVVDGLYAGSAAFLASPPPSSLPFPASFAKKKHDSATSDLRRLLGLDLL